METERGRISLRQRTYWPETVFAEMKGLRGLSRATLRGTMKVHIQALLALTVHNIRQLVKELGKKRNEPAQVLSLGAHVLASLWANLFPILLVG